MEEKKKINLLLISMSKFNAKIAESYYSYQEMYYFRGVSQLETGTKYYLRKLQGNGEKLDQIFIVESHDARTEQRDVSKLLECNNLCFLKSENDVVNATAVEFYKERISQYISSLETAHYDKIEPNLKDKKIMWGEIDAYEEKAKEQMPSLTQLYDDVHGLFKDIEMNDVDENSKTEEGAIYACVYDLCKDIQSFMKPNAEVNLYLDMQGARRYETFIINAAVKMLEMSGINVEESIATDFSPDNNKEGKCNKIVDTTINDRIFEMVSGMNEFLRTGRGETLQKFWTSSHKLIGLEAEKELIEQINKISDAISLCDVTKFNESLIAFSQKIEAYEKAEGKHPLFQTFARNLKSNYDKHHLLENDRNDRNDRNSKTINQIKWCLEKKLYQQALTLVEARIPDDIVDNKICYYKDDCELKKLLDKGRDSGWVKPPHYYLDTDGHVVSDKRKFVWIKYALYSKEIRNSDSNSASYENGNSDPNSNSEPNRASFYSLNLVSDLKKITYKGQISSQEQKNKNSGFGDLLKKYRVLCEYRNKINHALGGVPELEIIKGKLDEFVKGYENLLNSNVRIDYSIQRPLKKN